MAYAHAQTDPRAKMGSIIVVGGLHAAIGVGLIAALGVTVTTPDILPNPEAWSEPDVVIEVPPPEPADEPESAIRPSTPTAPDPIIPLNRPTEFTVDLPPVDPPVEVVRIPTPPLETLPLPPAPTPTFNPTAPIPRNGPQGWITRDDYPGSDLRRGNEGTARYSVTVNERGRVESCSVISSTGHSGLDRATCRHIERRARFEPALNAEQQPVGGTYTGQVTWQIPD